jgi:hypothetical protein
MLLDSGLDSGCWILDSGKKLDTGFSHSGILSFFYLRIHARLNESFGQAF